MAMASVPGAQAGLGNAQCCSGTGWEAGAIPRQEGLSPLVSLKGSHLSAPPGFQLPFPKQCERDEGVAAQTWGESLDVLRAGAELSGITGRSKKPGEGSGWLVGDGLPGTEDGAKPGGTRCCSPAFLGVLRLQRRRKSPHPKQWPWVFLTLLPEAAAGSQHRTQGSERFKYRNPPVSAPVSCSRGPQHQPPKGEAVLRHPLHSPCARPHPLAFQDKDDRDWDFLRTSKPSAGPQKMPVKRGTECSSETTAEQSSRKELPPRQTPLRTVAPVQRKKTSMFEDAEDDDLLHVLRRGKGPKKEAELRPARSTLDGLFGRGSAAKVLEKPEEEGRGDKKELVFGEYKPSMGSRPAVQPAVGQLVRFSANSSSETNPEPRSTPRPPRRRNPVRRRRAGVDWLGWEDEDFMEPPSQSRAAEEAVPKPDPTDWMIDALAPSRAEEQAKAQEIKAETMETQQKKAKPSETEEKKAEPSEAQEKKNKPSEAQDTEAEPSETAGEGPGPRSPGSQLAASPAALDCRAELLSAQARVAELESQVSPSACWMGPMGDPGGGEGAMSAPNSIRVTGKRKNLPVLRCQQRPPTAAVGVLSLCHHIPNQDTALRSSSRGLRAQNAESEAAPASISPGAQQHRSLLNPHVPLWVQSARYLKESNTCSVL
ncbi:uncharacterized protein [Patagioenas fasciata]|uniref:uncharacterized protein n=1 Tax=Patagioenas fasciata TaxID=372321 RepID=UPI003A99BDCA